MENKEKTIKEKIKLVNETLKKGEPINISVDNHSGYSGYKPQYVIDAMNNAFDIGEWGFEIKARAIKEFVTLDKEGNKKNNALALCTIQVWIKDVEFKPEADGQSRVTRGDFGDGMKGAQTDAIKKALSYFSIGNRAYHGLLTIKNNI